MQYIANPKVINMSNNHPNDNIYNILGKLEALKPTPEEKRFALVKEIRESVEAQGSILSGVDAVQAKLAKQFAESMDEKAPPGAKAERMVKHIKKSLSKDGKLSDKDKAIAYATTWKAHNKGQVEETDKVCAECGMNEGSCEHTISEAEITRTSGKTVHRKTDFPGYPTDDASDLDDLNGPGAGKRGRPRKHAVRTTPVSTTKGRPKKAPAPKYSTSNDPFGRVPSKAPASKIKGKVHTMSEAMNNLGKKLSSITESVNFKRMMEEQHMTLEEMLESMSTDIAAFKESGVCSDRLRDMMEVYAHAKKQMEETSMPTAAPAPMAPAGGIHGKFPDPMSAKDQQSKINPQRTYQEEITLEDELNELARLAGLDEVSRGEYIKQQDTAAERSGKDKFDAFGQEFDTDEIKEEDKSPEADKDYDKDGEIESEKDEVIGSRRKAAGLDEGADMSGGESEFNVTTSMNNDGDKNVTVTATGDHAANLLQMLRIAGLGSGDKAQELQSQGEPEVMVVGDDEGCEEVEEADAPVAMPADDSLSNSPDEQYDNVEATMRTGDADSTGAHRNFGGRGDNLMQQPPDIPAKPVRSIKETILALENELAAEYESIKKVSK
jgi:hypothetical protein